MPTSSPLPRPTWLVTALAVATAGVLVWWVPAEDRARALLEAGTTLALAVALVALSALWRGRPRTARPESRLDAKAGPTPRPEASGSGPRLSAILATLPGVVYRRALAARSFTYVSPGVLDLTGIAPGDLTDGLRAWLDLIHSDDRAEVEAKIRRAAMGGTTFRIEYRLVLDGGTLVRVRDAGSFSTEPASGETWIDGLLFDISAEVEAADELRGAVQAAEHANRTKSAFLAAMSHELRTPLNAIIGFTRIVHRNAAGGKVGPRDIAFLERVAANGEHLLGLINDILDLSKIEAGRMEFQREWVDPSAVVRDVLGSMEAQAAPKGLSLVLDAPSHVGLVEVDRVRFKQVLINLVGNAIKFTDQGGVVVGVEAIEGRVLAVHVRDTGIGIPADRLDAIFRPFEQAEAGTSRRFGGTGLGLSLSREMAEQMGCTLRVASVPGEGSTFSIGFAAERTRIPRATPPAMRHVG
jgi:signal transduction histidine kinase